MEKKIDRRKKYILMLDTETCNTLKDNKGNLDMSSVLVYDLGFQIIDKQGNIYEKGSYVISDIFFGEMDLMQSAYYARKLPKYYSDIAKGWRKVRTLFEVRKIIIDLMEEYRITTVAAHNARFDCNALNGTLRYLTKSKYRYFFPYGTEWWDTLKMATDTICKQKSYIRFCEDNNYMTKHKVPRVRATAEILYRYISGKHDFEESHTGLEDVKIETQILALCFRQHKKMRKCLFA